MNLWWTQGGTVAPCHYDGFHNIYVQLRGRKRFVLVPPAAAHRRLRFFPFLHPSHAQCQDRMPAPATLEGAVVAEATDMYLPVCALALAFVASRCHRML